MEVLIKEFTTHLFDIGLVNLRSIKDFIIILNEILSTKKKYQIQSSSEIREILLKTLNEFIFISSLEERKVVTEGIYKKFEEGKDIQKIKKNNILHSILSIKAKNIKKFYFQKWEKAILFYIISQNNKINSHTNLHKRKISKTKTEFSNRDQSIISNKCDFSASYPKSQMGFETTISLREKEDLKECTFKPKINKIDFLNDNQNRDNTLDTFTRLYTDHERYTKKKLMKSLQKDFRDSQIASFSPNISISNNKLDRSFSLKSKKFFDRLNQYEKIQRMKKNDIRETQEETFLKICTFSPQINKRELVFNENSKSVYKRLYDDNSRRKYNSHLNKKKEENEFENLANKKHMKSLDRNRIEKLYNDHKRFKNNKNIMQKNYDIQCGVTFKPNLPKEDRFHFNSNFHQRNELLLHKKNIFSDWYHKILKENVEGNKKYSENQAEEIKKDVVERLYNRDLDKFKQRKSSLCQYEDQKFDYVAELRRNNLNNDNFEQSYMESMNKTKSTVNNNLLAEEKRGSKNSSVLNTKNMSNLSNNPIKENTIISVNNDKNKSNISKQHLSNSNLNASSSLNDPNRNTVIHFKTDDPMNNNNNDYLITEIEANQKADASVKLPKGQNLLQYGNTNNNGNSQITNTNNSLINNKNTNQNQSLFQKKDELNYENRQKTSIENKRDRSRGKNNDNLQYLNSNQNMSMNISGKIKRRASYNENINNNYNQNNNFHLNQMSSIASPQNIMSTKASNFNAISVNEEERIINNSALDMSSNNTIEKINNNLGSINIENKNDNNNSHIEIK